MGEVIPPESNRNRWTLIEPKRSGAAERSLLAALTFGEDIEGLPAMNGHLSRNRFGRRLVGAASLLVLASIAIFGVARHFVA